MVVFRGIGGVGKSELVENFIHRVGPRRIVEELLKNRTCTEMNWYPQQTKDYMEKIVNKGCVFKSDTKPILPIKVIVFHIEASKVTVCNEMKGTLEEDIERSLLHKEFAGTWDVVWHSVTDFIDSCSKIPLNELLTAKYEQKVGKGAFGDVSLSCLSIKNVETLMVVKKISAKGKEGPAINDMAKFIKDLGKHKFWLIPDLILSTESREVTLLMIDKGGKSAGMLTIAEPLEKIEHGKSAAMLAITEWLEKIKHDRKKDRIRSEMAIRNVTLKYDPSFSDMVYQLDFSVTYHSNNDVFKDSIPLSILRVLTETLSSKVKVNGFQHIKNGTQKYLINFSFLIYGHHENLYRLIALETQKLVNIIKLALKKELDGVSSYITYWHYQNLDNNGKRLKDLNKDQIQEIGDCLGINWYTCAMSLNDEELEKSSRFSELMFGQDGGQAGAFVSLLPKRYPLLIISNLMEIIGNVCPFVHEKNVDLFQHQFLALFQLFNENDTRMIDLRMRTKLELLKFLNVVLDQFESPKRVLFWKSLLEEFVRIPYDDLEQHVKKRMETMSNPGAELISILKYHHPDVLVKSLLDNFGLFNEFN